MSSVQRPTAIIERHEGYVVQYLIIPEECRLYNCGMRPEYMTITTDIQVVSEVWDAVRSPPKVPIWNRRRSSKLGEVDTPTAGGDATV